MVKFIFVCLLIGNILLFLFTHGYLGDTSLEAHDPARLQKQKNVAGLTLMPADVALAVPAAVSASSVSASAAGAAAGATSPPPACLSWGIFLPEDVARVESKLAVLALGDRQSRQNVQDTGSYMVFIPSQGSREGADKKAANLMQLGIKDYFIIQDQSKLRWGISLGIFKTEDAARQHLLNLNGRGVHTAKVGARTVATNKFIYQLRKLSGIEKEALDALKVDFPDQNVIPCK